MNWYESARFLLFVVGMFLWIAPIIGLMISGPPLWRGPAVFLYVILSMAVVIGLTTPK